MSSAEKNYKVPPPLDLVNPPLQIIVDDEEHLIGSPLPKNPDPIPDEDHGSSRSVSPCPSITVDTCEHKDKPHDQEEAEPDDTNTNTLSPLPIRRRRHSDVTQSVRYYKTSLLAASRSDNVLSTFHKSLDIVTSSNPSVLSLPTSRYGESTPNCTRIIAALCSPEARRKHANKQKLQDTNTSEDNS